MRCLSAKAGSRSVLAALASKAKLINRRYEKFLERTFPRFYVLHATFTKGGSRGGGDLPASPGRTEAAGNALPVPFPGPKAASPEAFARESGT